MELFNIFHVIAIGFCILNFVFREYRIKNVIVDAICTLLYFSACVYILWYNCDIKLSILGIIGGVTFIVAEIFLTFFERFLKELDSIKNRIDDCEYSIRLDVADLPKRIITEEANIFGEVYNVIEDASKKKE